MIRPTPRSVLALAVCLPMAALPTIAGDGGLWPVWLVLIGVLMFALVVDWALLPGPRAVAIHVEAPAVVQLGDAGIVEVKATARRRVRVEARIEVRGDVAPLPEVVLLVEPGLTTAARAELQPERRGTVRLRALHARWSGPLGLLWCETVTRVDRNVQVVTNVRAVRQRAAMIAARHELQTGLRVERFVGDGSEFESLREFVTGMDRRAIDWKATARHRQALCREFRAERDHAVMLCIDTGRLMGEPLRGLPRLDRAIHAALQLGYVCLQTGDRVGMFAFADKPRTVVLPQAGVHALQAIQTRMASLEYSSEETNFTLAMTELLQRLARRTLVVLFTDFVDSVTAELMLRNVRWLARRHLLVFVAMRDPLPASLVARPPHTIEDVHRSVVADEIERERLLVLERLHRAGALIVDVDVEDIESGLVARYLQIKRRELL